MARSARLTILWWLTLAGVIASVFVLPVALGDLQGKQLGVMASDLVTRVPIIGRLGRPLGQMTTVRGVWHAELAKDMSPQFRVTHIDGKEITRSIDFLLERMKPLMDDYLLESPVEDMRPTSGDVWELRGYETGKVVGLSDEVMKGLHTSVQQPNGFSFVTRFVYIRAKWVERTR